MRKGSAVIRCAYVFAVCSAACASGDSNDGGAAADGRVQAGDASLDANEDGSEIGPVQTDAGEQVSDGSTSEHKDAGGARDAGASCPPECFRAYTCAASCSAPAFNNGCCPCPAGTIDTITCSKRRDDAGGGGH